MYRVIITIAAVLSLFGCSMGLEPNVAGFADGQSHTAQITEENLSGFGRSDTLNYGQSRSSQPAFSTGSLPKKRVASAKPKGNVVERSAHESSRLNPIQAQEIINQYRQENGLKPLKLNPYLTEAAKNHSRDLANTDRISHFGSDGSNPWDRVSRTGFKPRLAAENVGTGQVTIKDVFKGWRESPGHDKNLLLPDATHMGIALVRAPKTEFKTFWTLVLGTPL